MTLKRGWAKSGLNALVLSALVGFLPGVKASAETVCAEVRLEIKQEATLEREAFDAMLEVTNQYPAYGLTNFRVDVVIKDPQGKIADSLFFVKISSKEAVNAVDGTGTIQPASTATIHWLIIPSTGSGGVNPLGLTYSVRADISYDLNGEHQTVSTFDANIVVKPQPVLKLEYVLPFEIFSDEPLTEGIIEPVEPFPLGVRITNVGYGPAKNFQINSGQPEIIENKQGLAIDFKLLGTYVGDKKIPDTLLIPFGDISAGSVTQAAWIMATSLSGRFVKFDATFTHAAELGGQLTSLIQDVTTYTLIKDVLVDLPGRDSQFDFLVNTTTPRDMMENMLAAGKEIIPNVILESDQPEPIQVVRLASELSGELSGANTSATLHLTESAGPNLWVFTSMPAPQDGRAKLMSAVRQDGKIIKSQNIWISRHFSKATTTYSYRLNLIDYDPPPMAEYTLDFSRESLDAAPAPIADLSASTMTVGGQARLNWSATGEDANSGAILGGRYLIQEATSPVAEFSPSLAQVNFTTNTAPGVSQTYLIKDLAGNTSHYLKLWLEDTGGSISADSNLAEAYVLPNPPVNLAVGAISSTTVAVSWSGGNNYLPIEYGIWADTDAILPAASAAPFKDSFDKGFVFEGLTPNTTYLFYGLAKNPESGVSSEQVYLGAALTQAAAPGQIVSSQLFISSFTVAWDPGANSGPTEYFVQISTMADWSLIAGESGWIAQADYAFNDLLPDTTYYARAQARNSAGLATAFADLGILRTKSADSLPPATNISFSTSHFGTETVYVSSRTEIGLTAFDDVGVIGDKLGVVANSYYSVDSDTFTVYAGTFSIAADGVYVVRYYSVDAAGHTEAVKTSSVTVDNVSPVVLVDIAGVVYSSGGVSYIPAASTVTLGASDQTAGVKELYYELNGSTYSVAASSITLELSEGVYTLAYNAADNVGNFSGLQISSITVDNTAPLSVFKADGYSRVMDGKLYVLSGSSVSVSASDALSGVKEIYYSLDGSTASAASPLSLQPGAGEHTLAFYSADNVGNVEAEQSVTFFVDIAAPYSSVSETGLTANWVANGEPAGTLYRADISTAPGFTGTVVSSVTENINAVFAELSANTTYYGRVRVEGAPPSDYTLLGATATFADPPTATGVLSAAVDTVTMTWGGNGNPAGTLYQAAISTAPDFTGTVVTSATVNTLAELSGLVPNTTYYLRVRAVGHGGTATAYDATVSTMTLPAQPAAAAYSEVAADALTLNWGAHGNPAGTVYQANISTAADFTGEVVSSATTSILMPFTGLVPNTTYYGRVRAEGVTPSAYTALGPALTPANHPGAAVQPFSGLDSLQVTAAWEANGNPAGTNYTLKVSTASDFSGSLDMIRTGIIATSTVTASLVPNTTYFFKVNAANSANEQTAYLDIGSTVTLANAPVAAALSGVGTNALTANWLDNGNPQGTLYRTDISTASDFTGIVITSSTAFTSAVFTGLDPNTIYHLQVMAINHGGIPTAYAALGSTTTLPNPPVAAAYSTVSVSGLAANWTANGNPAGTIYKADISTTADFADILVSSVTIDFNTVFMALTANTTYYGRVRAEGATPSDYTLLGATATLANPPAGSDAVSAATDTVTATWNANGNPAGTLYQADLSSDAGFGTVVSSVTQTLTAWFGGLSPNTTYYLHVRAVGYGGTATGYDAAVSTMTLPAQPVSAPYNGVAADALTLNWSANGNPAGTIYKADISTAADFADILVSSVTTDFKAVFTALTANTTYYGRVRAEGATPSAYISLSSTVTLANAPVVTAISGVGTNALTANWQANGNPAATLYQADLSSDPGFGTAVSSVTQSLTAGFTGLVPNTTYYARVRAVGYGGTATAYDATVSTMTLPAQPLAAPYSGVAADALILNWTANGNPAGTIYKADISTAADFTGEVVSSATTNILMPFTGLVPNTTYYGRVRAEGITPSAYTALDSALTPANRPNAAVIPFSGLGSGQVTVAWEANGNPVWTNYTLKVSTASDFSASLDMIHEGITATSYVAASLVPNTTYFFKVNAADSANEETAYLDIGSTATLANAPVATALSGVGTSALTAIWQANGNPAGTLYQADLSSDPGFGTAVSSVTQSLTAWFTGLVPNTTYYARVRAVGHGGTATAYDATVSTMTLPAQPLAAPYSGVAADALILNWTANGNPAGTIYKADISTAADFTGEVVSSATTNILMPFTGLVPNTTYYGRVRAEGLTPSAYTWLGSALTPANRPGAAAQPFSGLGSVQVTAAWEANGNSAWTNYTLKVSTAYDFTGSLDMIHAGITATSYAAASLVPNTTYFFKVNAADSANEETAYLDIGSTATLANAPVATAISGVGINALSAGWQANGNPAGTLYQADLSSDPGFGTAVSSVTQSLTAWFTGLVPNTAYYARARAVGYGGTATGYDATVSTMTLPAQPLSAAYSGVAADALTLNWLANGNPAGTIYKADISTAADFSDIFISSVTTDINSVFTALTANTTYYGRVRAEGATPSAYISLSSMVTLANAPVATAISGVGTNALSAGWQANGNPAGTLYQADLSSDPGFGTAVSSVTRTLTAGFTGLVPNTTYYTRVRAVGYGGTATGYDATVSTMTLPAQPLSAPYSGVAADALTLNWLANGNPAGTIYKADISTAADFSDIFISSVTTDINSVFTALTANTTYYGRVRAEGATPSAYTFLSSTVTLANAPVATAISGVGINALSAGWQANGNPAGTLYQADLSSDPGFGTAVSSVTQSLTAWFTGLVPNTTYYARVRAVGYGGTATGYDATVSTMTLPSQPVSAPYSGLAADALTLNWLANGNPLGTVYQTDISTAADFAGEVISSATTNILMPYAGLVPNTTYYGRVRADGITPSAYTWLGSALTPANRPGAAAQPFNGLGSVQVTAAWEANGNPVGTEYTLKVSTAYDFTGSLDMIHAGITATNFAAASLVPNTVYFFEVNAVNSANEATAYLDIGSTVTLANAPVAGALSGIGTNALTANWLANGNPQGTLYRTDISTSSDFTGLVITSATAFTSAVFTGLNPNTIYHLQVKAINHGGIPTAYAALGSTTTLPNPPAAAAYSAVSVSGLTANWTANGNPAGTIYKADISTEADFADMLISSVTADINAVFTALTANTTYYGRVRAEGATPSAYTSLSSTVTLANAPLATTISGAGTNALTVSWQANGNPAGTLYQADLSSDPGFGTAVSSVTQTFTAGFTGLVPNTTYYLHVRAVGHGGTETAYDATVSIMTLPAQPTAASYSGVAADALTLNWTANGNPAGTIYKADISTAADFTGEVVSSATTNVLMRYTGLVPNTTYYGRVRAEGITPSAYTALDSALTPANRPNAAVIPFSGLGSGQVTVTWEANGNPAWTNYTLEISTASDFSGSLDMIHTGISATSYAAAPLVPNTTYFFKVNAADSANEQTSYLDIGSTATLANAPVASALSVVGTTALTENWQAGGNPAGTMYQTELSIASDFTGPVMASSTADTSAVFAGLVPNTTYYARVRAVGHGGTATAYDATVSTMTLPAQPAAAPYSGVATDALTLNWMANGNPAGTLYRTDISTASGFTVILVSSVTADISAVFTALTANTTYYGRVRAEGATPSAYTFLSSTVTLANVPVATTISGVGINALSAGWQANGNPAGTLYQADLSSDPGFDTAVSSVTQSLTAWFTGLVPNTTYYARVRAVGYGGTATGYDATLSTMTLPAPPTAGPYSGVDADALTLNWNANGNPAGTIYKADISTAADFTGEVISSATTNILMPYAGLVPNTTYYGRVRADGITPSAYTWLGSALTPANRPGAAAQPFSGLGSVQVTAAWEANVNPVGTNYTLKVSTASDFSGSLDMVHTGITATSYAAASLVPNTVYFFEVNASNSANEQTSYLYIGSTVTLANAPVAADLSGVGTTALTANWLAAGNPGGTTYQAELSTAADFTGLVVTSSTANMWAVFAGLVPNTTHYLRVRAVNESGTPTVYVGLGSTSTLPDPPAASAYSAVSVSRLTANWTANGNPAGTIYKADISTAADFSDIFISSVTTDISAVFTALTANTTYYGRVRAEGVTPSAYTSLSSTVTLANAPVATAISGVGANALTAGWQANGNPAGTSYQADLSSDPGFGTAVSSVTQSLTAGFTGLVPNTTYYARARAVGYGGTATAYDATSSTMTLPAQPLSAPYSGVATNALTLNWGANGNPAGTLYRADISTAASFTGPVVSSVTADINAVFTALTANTTYYGRVRVEGPTPSAEVSLSSIVTLANTPLAVPISGVGSNALTANWLANGNPYGTLYQADISTASDFTWITAGSATANTSAWFSGLVPNTTYYVRVLAVNYNGLPTSFAVIPATITPVAEPLAGQPSDIGASSITVNWSANGNPAWTQYRVEISSDEFASATGSSTTIATHATFTGLFANVTYYFHMQSIGNNGQSTAWIALPSARTLLMPPGQSGNTFPVVGVSSAVVQWTSGGNAPGTQYLCQVSTDNFATLNYTAEVYDLSAWFGTGGAGPALQANTTHYFRVHAANGGTNSADIPLGSIVTLAYAPGAITVLAVTSATVNLDWPPNGNPEPGTGYEVWRDTQPGFITPVKVTVPASELLINGLIPKTTYYFKVRSVNLSGVFSGFGGTASATTFSAPPGALTLNGTALGVSSVSWTWNYAGDVDGYSVINSTGGSISGVLAADVVNWPEIGLSANTAYSRKVAAFNPSGGSASALVTRYTLAVPPTGSAFTDVYLTSAAVQWDGGANPAWTSYEVKYWAAGGSTTTVTVAATSAALTGLAEGTVVYAMVRALNGDNIPTSYDVTLSTRTSATVQTVHSNTDTQVTFQGPSGEVTIDIPSGTFAEDVELTVSIPAPQDCPAPSGEMSSLATPVCIKLTLNKPVQPALNVELSVSYKNSDLGGMDRTRLVLARYDETHMVWIPLFSTRDDSANMVTARVNHFSVFQIIQSNPAPDLSNVSIGPNILRPSRDPGQLMTFRNLPSGARVRIYTLVGELIHDTTEDGTGNAIWNGKNRSGKQVASGIYIVLIEGRGKKKVFRVAVER